MLLGLGYVTQITKILKYVKDKKRETCAEMLLLGDCIRFLVYHSREKSFWEAGRPMFESPLWQLLTCDLNISKDKLTFPKQKLKHYLLGMSKLLNLKPHKRFESSICY